MIATAKSTYKEDVSTLAAGSELIGAPCVVYSITVTKEADGDAIVSFSNTIDAYDTDYRIEKVCTTAEQHTVHLTFPNGLLCSTGLCATSNLASVDVSVTYE